MALAAYDWASLNTGATQAALAICSRAIQFHAHFPEWMAVVWAVSMLINCFVMLYVNQCILPKVEDQLKNCTLVADARRFWGLTGYIGKTQRSAAVFLALTSTRSLSKKGMVDMDEISRISPGHRRWICIPIWTGGANVLSGIWIQVLLGQLW